MFDDPGIASHLARIEGALPVGVRPRQLGFRTLLAGMLLVLSNARRAHLTRVHEALLTLAGPDRASGSPRFRGNVAAPSPGRPDDSVEALRRRPAEQTPAGAAMTTPVGGFTRPKT